MLRELMETMEENMGYVSRELGTQITIQTEMLETKYTVTEIKNAFKGLINSQKKNRALKDLPVGTSQTERQREKRLKFLRCYSRSCHMVKQFHYYIYIQEK